jgi:hypothetical protein
VAEEVGEGLRTKARRASSGARSLTYNSAVAAGEVRFPFGRSDDVTDQLGRKIMSLLENLLAEFARSVGENRVEIYNEFSLQHEIGIFLRHKIPTERVQFERNVDFFFSQKPSFVKKEIDISIFSPDKKDLRCAIELKFPRNGQYPEQMFSFCKDIAFAEQLCRAGFSSAALVIFVDDPLFYSGTADGIYGFFRGPRQIHGLVQKPTGSKDSEVNIEGSYAVQWKQIHGPLVYSIIEIGALH